MRTINADAIDEVISTLNEQGWNITRNEYKLINNVLFEFPTIEVEPRWIPVTEKLPEENEAVNVTWVNHLPENYYKSIKDKPFTATAVFYRGDWYWWSDTLQDYLAEYGLCPIYRMDRAIEVIAWMPLPEPARLENS